jgi:hypothetical protein
VVIKNWTTKELIYVLKTYPITYIFENNKFIPTYRFKSLNNLHQVLYSDRYNNIGKTSVVDIYFCNYLNKLIGSNKW